MNKTKSSAYGIIVAAANTRIGNTERMTKMTSNNSEMHETVNDRFPANVPALHGETAMMSQPGTTWYRNACSSRKRLTNQMVAAVAVCCLTFSVVGFAPDAAAEEQVVLNTMAGIETEESHVQQLKADIANLRTDYAAALETRKQAFLATIQAKSASPSEVKRLSGALEAATEAVESIDKGLQQKEKELLGSQKKLAGLKRLMVRQMEKAQKEAERNLRKQARTAPSQGTKAKVDADAKTGKRGWLPLPKKSDTDAVAEDAAKATPSAKKASAEREMKKLEKARKREQDRAMKAMEKEQARAMKAKEKEQARAMKAMEKEQARALKAKEQAKQAKQAKAKAKEQAKLEKAKQRELEKAEKARRKAALKAERAARKKVKAQQRQQAKLEKAVARSRKSAEADAAAAWKATSDAAAATTAAAKSIVKPAAAQTSAPVAAAAVMPSAGGPRILVIDDFNKSSLSNRLGNRANIYEKEPSAAMIGFVNENVDGSMTGVLKLNFDKQNEGGPYGRGGWCGYYSVLKDASGGYLDASAYNYITFKVRGETGTENFVIGLSDERWDKLGDSVKSKQISTYLNTDSLGTEWRTARVPLDAFSVGKNTLASISFCFESYCFPSGAGSGVIYLDNLALEK